MRPLIPECLDPYVCEAFHSLGPALVSCLMKGPLLGVSPTGTGHRLQGAGLMVLLAGFIETLKGSEQHVFPGSLICGGC